MNMTPSVIEPATFRLLSQCLNQMRRPVPHWKLLLPFIFALGDSYDNPRKNAKRKMSVLTLWQLELL
jgi:hypothetical protein